MFSVVKGVFTENTFENAVAECYLNTAAASRLLAELLFKNL